MNPSYRLGLLILIIAIMSWGLGTIYTKKINVKNNNLFLNLFYQFAFAGIIQLIFAFSFSETIDISAWSVKSVSAIIYLAVFGSVLAFSRIIIYLNITTNTSFDFVLREYYHQYFPQLADSWRNNFH
jgi:drug/metabolite transporter (DMT)-like permease